MQDYSLYDLDTRAERALQICGQYVEDCHQRYEQAVAYRKSRGISVAAFCGYGRAGKDTAAEYLGKRYGLRYPQSTSYWAAPLIAEMANTSVELAITTRHSNRRFWKDACEALRRKDQLLLVRMCLGAGDMVAGVRGLPEFRAMVATQAVSLTVWISNPRVPVDDTVDYASADCHLTVENAGTLTDFYAKLDKLAPLIVSR